MPAMSSASVAVTAPSVSRTPRYERDDFRRKIEVARMSSGITVKIPSASCHERTNRITAVPTSVSVFCTSEETPSVTSWSSASTSFVILLIRTPARLRSKNPSDRRCRCRKRWLRRSASIRSPVQPGEVRLGPRGADPDQAGPEEGGDDPGQRAGVAGTHVVDCDADEDRRRERRRGRREEREDRQRGPEAIRAGETVERGQPPLRGGPGPVVDLHAPLRDERAPRLPDPHATSCSATARSKRPCS